MLQNFSLFLPCFTCIFWVITLFLQRKTNNRSQNIWILGGFVLSISTFVWGIFFSGVKNYSLFYKLELLEAFCTLLLIPFLYLFFRTLTDERQYSFKEFLWFLPAILIGGSMLVIYLIMGDEQAVVYISEVVENQGKLTVSTDPIYRIHNFISVYLYNIVVLVQIVYILIYATVRLIRYRNRLKDFFSNQDKKSLGNGTVLLIILYFMLALSLVTYRGRFHYNESSLFISFLMVVWAVVIYIMGYNIYTLRYTAKDFADELKISDDESVQEGYEGISEIDSPDEIKDSFDKIREKILPELTQLMEKDKIFLKNDLRLDEVARKLHTNRTYISKIIHEEYGCNFSDFISQKRVEYAQSLIASNPQLTQEQVAEMSGFTHPSTFSRLFKRHAGITFRDFSKRYSA